MPIFPGFFVLLPKIILSVQKIWEIFLVLETEEEAYKSKMLKDIEHFFSSHKLPG